MKLPLLALLLLTQPLAAQGIRVPPPLLTDDTPLADDLSRLSTQPSPEPFIRELYNELRQPPLPPPFLGAHGASHIYADPLLSSMHKLYRTSAQRFAGPLDFNPFCACQDSTGIVLSPISLTAFDKRHTDASLRLQFPPSGDTKRPDRSITLHLVRTEHGWRVDDVSSADVKSLKLLLRDQPPSSIQPNPEPH